MKVWTCGFKGVWLGGDAVIVADSAEKAAEQLSVELALIGLSQEIRPEDCVRVMTTKPAVFVLDNGSY